MGPAVSPACAGRRHEAGEMLSPGELGPHLQMRARPLDWPNGTRVSLPGASRSAQPGSVKNGFFCDRPLSLSTQFGVAANSRIPFIVVALAAAGIWRALAWRYSGTIEGLEARLKQRDDEVADLRGRLAEPVAVVEQHHASKESDAETKTIRQIESALMHTAKVANDRGREAEIGYGSPRVVVPSRCGFASELADPQTARPAEAPSHRAAGLHDARDLPAHVVLQRRFPGHQLEPQPAVDHREPA